VYNLDDNQPRKVCF